MSPSATMWLTGVCLIVSDNIGSLWHNMQKILVYSVICNIVLPTFCYYYFINSKITSELTWREIVSADLSGSRLNGTNPA